MKLGDEVLWAFDAFSKTHFLKLEGPATVLAGRPTQFTVTDGMVGGAVGNATVVASGGVGSQVSDAEGHVTFTFRTPGIRNLKADREESIRSNGVSVVVI